MFALTLAAALAGESDSPPPSGDAAPPAAAPGPLYTPPELRPPVDTSWWLRRTLGAAALGGAGALLGARAGGLAAPERDPCDHWGCALTLGVPLPRDLSRPERAGLAAGWVGGGVVGAVAFTRLDDFEVPVAAVVLGGLSPAVAALGLRRAALRTELALFDAVGTTLLVLGPPLGAVGGAALSRREGAGLGPGPAGAPLGLTLHLRW